MPKSTSTDRIDRGYLAQLCRERGIVFAGLFGSQARGEATNDSDVDLLVRFDGRRSLIDLVRIDLVTENVLGTV